MQVFYMYYVHCLTLEQNVGSVINILKWQKLFAMLQAVLSLHMKFSR